MKFLGVFYAPFREQLSETVCAMQDASDAAFLAEIDAAISQLRTTRLLLVSDQLYLYNSLFSSLRRLDIPQELLDQKDVTEIMMNDKDRIFAERHGKIERYDLCFLGEEQLEDTIQCIVSRVNRSVNVSIPTANARLPDGSWVHIVLPSIFLGGPAVTTRKLPEPIMMEALIGFGTLTAEAAVFLKEVVAAGCNIFINGGTNSSKTTLLNALSAFIPKTERAITIEDFAESQLLHAENPVRLETCNRNAGGKGRIHIADPIRTSLRMSPDRVIASEMRGVEALDMLQTMSAGHDGSFSTGHVNSTTDMLTRLETTAPSGANLPLVAIQQQITSALGSITHPDRLRDRSRRVLSITKIEGVLHGETALHNLLTFQEEREQNGFRVQEELRVIETLKRRGRLDAAGLAL